MTSKCTYGLQTAIFRFALIAFVGIFSAQGNQLTVVPGFGPYDSGGGGEYTVIPDAALAAQLGPYGALSKNYVQLGSFQTFCVERNEYIVSATTYDVTLNNITVFSGVPLSIGTAYLYQQFALGTLAGYHYTDIPASSRAFAVHGSAFELQRALWYYMGEYSYDPYNIYMNGIVALPANPFKVDNGAHQVAILNLWSPGQPHDAAHAYQDVLTLVPEPATFALASLGAAALLAFRKRR